MLDAAVEQVNARDAGLQRADRALQLRDHPAVHDAVSCASRSSTSSDAELGQQLAAGSDHAGHVVQVDELLGLEPDRELRSHHVGVHVERAGRSRPRRSTRPPGRTRCVHQRAEHVGVHAHHLADEAEVGFGLLARRRRGRRRRRTARPPARRRRRAMPTTSVFSLPASTIVATSSVVASVTRTPSTNDVSRPSRSRDLRDLRSAAVNDHGVDPGVLEERDVLARTSGTSGARFIAAPPYLIDDDLAPVLLHERQRLEEACAPSRPCAGGPAAAARPASRRVLRVDLHVLVGQVHTQRSARARGRRRSRSRCTTSRSRRPRRARARPRRRRSTRPGSRPLR